MLLSPHSLIINISFSISMIYQYWIHDGWYSIKLRIQNQTEHDRRKDNLISTEEHLKVLKKEYINISHLWIINTLFHEPDRYKKRRLTSSVWVMQPCGFTVLWQDQRQCLYYYKNRGKKWEKICLKTTVWYPTRPLRDIIYLWERQ